MLRRGAESGDLRGDRPDRTPRTDRRAGSTAASGSVGTAPPAPTTAPPAPVRSRNGSTAQARPQPPTSGRPAVPLARGRRNPRWIALGALLICLGALASYVLYAAVSDSQQVVAVRTSVPRGAVIQADQVTVVTIGQTTGISVVPADRLGEVVGRRTAVDLVAGSLLPPDAVDRAALPAPGRAVVGLRVADGRAPRGLLEPGGAIRIISVPAEAAAQGADTTEVSVVARVVSAAPSADGQSVLLDVDVASTQAAAVARLAAQDRVAVIRDTDG